MGRGITETQWLPQRSRNSPGNPSAEKTKDLAQLIKREIITEISRDQSSDDYWFRDVAGGKDCGEPDAALEHNQGDEKGADNGHFGLVRMSRLSR